MAAALIVFLGQWKVSINEIGSTSRKIEAGCAAAGCADWLLGLFLQVSRPHVTCVTLLLPYSKVKRIAANPVANILAVQFV